MHSKTQLGFFPLSVLTDNGKLHGLWLTWTGELNAHDTLSVPTLPTCLWRNQASHDVNPLFPV